MKQNKIVCGVGINDSEYPVYQVEIVDGKKKIIWTCPFYSRWKDMLKRCYSEGVKFRFPTYVGCITAQEWHRLSVFKSWMKGQDWENKFLDKDILLPNNKIYCPDTCVFVDENVNNFIVERRSANSQYPIGVYMDKRSFRFQVKCGNPFTGKPEHLGCFGSSLEAHQAWLDRKTQLAYALASQQSDPRVSAALIDRYENYHKYFGGVSSPVSM